MDAATTSSERQDMEESGRKRKHQDESETGASPAKKAKSRSRNEKRLKRMSAKAEHKKEYNASEEPSPKPEPKKKSRKHRERRKTAEAPDKVPEAAADAALEEDVVEDVAIDAEKEKRKQEKKARREAARAEKSAAVASLLRIEAGANQNTEQEGQAMTLPSRSGGRWKMSEKSGGRFVQQDPLFVRDAGGEYIIAAVGHELQVLSLKTSLLVRSLPARKETTILAFAIESAGSDMVYVADDKGTVRSWDWTKDLPARTVESLNGSIRAVAATRLDEADGNIVFPHITWAGGLYIVKVQNTEYRTKRRLNSLQLLEGPGCILAQGPDVLVAGFRQDKEGYNWVELPLSKRATCMNARTLDHPGVSKKGSKMSQVQLAIGYDDGQIYIYHDITALSQGRNELPEPRILHWHRSAVSSIKFSPDGNYLISGGTETVLVLWQLETGRKQYVPHLTSEIERITINASGDRYALQMGDNSIMVMSTAELKPVANFAGLQLQTVESEGSTAPAAMLNPGNPKQLLLTVPPTLPANAQESAPRPFLQTFDLREARHMMRQALTRNNATDLNTGPEYNAILPPDVALLAVSRDGQWLATVDDWMPPAADVAHLATNHSEAEEARKSRREVYLKVWHWDSQQEIWTLSTRADAPHQRAGSQSMGAGRIAALMADPASNAFATVGEDSCVKIWKPKTRMRGGVAMKDAQDADLIEWTCRRSVQLPTANDHADPSPVGGTYPSELSAVVAAYSSDGSLLAVSSRTPTVVDESVPAVTFIDTASGTIKAVDAGLSDGTPMTAVAFVERYFIAVTHRAAFVWDLVAHTLTQKIKLPHAAGARPLLAVSEADQTFALASPAPPAKKAVKTRVAVYTTREAKKAWKQDFATEIVKVLAGKGSRGYTLLFADATVRTVSRAGGAMAARLRSAAPATEVPTLPLASDAMDVDGAQTAGLYTSAIAGAPAVEVGEDDRPVVRPEQLASIFDVGQSFAMPPVKDMFHAVVGLFGRKPQPRVAAV